MAATTFDSILNWIIPIAVLLIFGYLLLKPFGEPFGKLWGWIKEVFSGSGKKDKMDGIQYE